MKRLFSPIMAMAMLLAWQPAAACSLSWKSGWSPEEIKQRADVRKVIGRWHLEEVAGERFSDEDGTEWIRNARLRGRIETLRGTGWDTTHEPRIRDLTCIYYFKPEADAEGTFWISRRKTDGRYRILLWEGRYIAHTNETD